MPARSWSLPPGAEGFQSLPDVLPLLRGPLEQRGSPVEFILPAKDLELAADLREGLRSERRAVRLQAVRQASDRRRIASIHGVAKGRNSGRRVLEKRFDEVLNGLPPLPAAERRGEVLERRHVDRTFRLH